MLKSLFLILLSAGGLFAQIHIAFHNGTTTRNGMTSRPDGAVVATSTDHWNNPTNNSGEGTNFSGFALLDVTGSDSGATLAVNAGHTAYDNNGWQTETQDWVMMEGWYGFRSNESIVISNLPAHFAAGYSVIIYGDSSSNRTMNYTVNDGTTNATKTIQDTGTFSGSFTDGVNRVSFSGLSGSSLTITGNAGASSSRSAVSGLILIPEVIPKPPVIDGFSASDHYVTAGTAVTLNWQVNGADSLTIDQGIGDVTSASSTVVTVNTTTNFTLTATNADGTSTAKLRVGVGPARPNILVFLVDDMGPHDTSVPFLLDGGGNPVSYNFNTFYQTPNMESLAASGMRFTTAYGQTVCSPTRCGIMTGRNSARHAVTDYVGAGSAGVPVNWRLDGLSSSDVTLPAQLQNGGYRTIHVGKAHFAVNQTTPEDLGFDINIAGNEWGQPWGGYIGSPGYGGMPGMEAYDGSLFLTKALTLEANQALEDAVDDDTPFFLHMSFYAVHTPVATNPDATGDYSAAVSTIHQKFSTMLEGVDIAVGEIRQKLVDLGVAQNTFILFLGDNGSDSPATTQDGLPSGSFGDWPMRGKKATKWEGGARVPLIACWGAADPNNVFQQALPIPANSIETDIVTTWDLPVTLLEIAGLDQAADFGEDGYSLSPYFSGTPGTHRPQELVIHYPHNHRSDFFSWIRVNDMKLIYDFKNNSHELYNLATDPTESINLAATQPETAMSLARRLAQKLDLTWGPSGVLMPTVASTAPAGNVISIPTSPTVDVDHDGIPDNSEDPNANGLVDSGETNPDSDNTDGDSTPDGAEVRTGTDPLDPSNFFRLDYEVAATGRVQLTWPSAPGALYRVESSTTLSGWSVIQDDVPADPNAPTTTFDAGILPLDPARFWRTILK